MNILKARFVVFVFLALLITDMWIVSFQQIHKFLIFHIPVFYPKGFFLILSPKPFDIPLYLLLITLFVAGIGIFINKLYVHAVHLYQKNKKNKILVGGGILILVLVLIYKIGYYPEFVFPSLKNTPWWFLYLIEIGFFVIVELFLFTRLQKKIKFFITITAVLVGIITFEPGFPISWFDYAYIFGPAYAIAHGQTIYTQIPSQYGFLLEYVLAGWMKINIESIFYLPMFIWVLYIGAYCSLFFVLLRLSKSILLSVLFLSSVITINYFSLLHLPIFVPQIGPLRFFALWFAPFIFYLTYFHRRLKYIGFMLFALMACWVIDVGIQTLVALFCLELILVIKRAQSWESFLKHTAVLVFSPVAFFYGISFLGLFLGYKLLSLFSLFHSIITYAGQGLGMLPFPGFTPFWVFMLTFFASTLLVFLKNKLNQADIVMIFSALLFILGALYYVGRSHEHNLFHLSAVFLFTLFLLLSNIQQIYNLLFSQREKIQLFLLGFFIFVVCASVVRQPAQATIFSSNIHNIISGKLVPQGLEQVRNLYDKDVLFISSNTNDRKLITISPDDTYLFILSKKTPLLHVNPLNTIVSESDLTRAFIGLDTCPQKIFVARCFKTNTCQQDKTFLGLFVTEDKVLSKIQSICSYRYQFSSCSTHICEMQFSSIK